MSIDVVIVDDQELVRTGLRMVLSNAPDIEVVGEASNGGDAVAVVEQIRPDIVLMDIRMPGMDGVEATRRIRAAFAAPEAGPRIVILTTFDLDQYVFAGLRAGASGFLLKDTLADELLQAVRVIASGEAVIAPAVTRRLLERFVGSLPPDDRVTTRLDVLSPREREVLELLAYGLSNAEIAAKLFLSEGTVKAHVSRIFAKLGLRDRVQAVILAYETGLIRAGFREL
jgi:DNA-binding NarL/FixJ family response regulator